MRPRYRNKPPARWRGYWPVMLTGFILGWVVVSGLWVWQRLNDPQALPFHDVKVSGQFQHLNPAQLRQFLLPQIHGGFFVLKMEPLKQSLLKTPWVEEVSIRRIPGTLYVNVQEHQPVARWNDQFLINSHDQVIPAPRDTPDGLPTLYGPQDSEQLVLSYFQQMNVLLKPLNLQIQQIRYDERKNWELVLNNGVTVTIGRDDVLPRMERLARWYPRIVGDQPITHIDLRYPNSIALAR
jgi:cell division protein FtsQ